MIFQRIHIIENYNPALYLTIRFIKQIFIFCSRREGINRSHQEIRSAITGIAFDIREDFSATIKVSCFCRNPHPIHLRYIQGWKLQVLRPLVTSCIKPMARLRPKNRDIPIETRLMAVCARERIEKNSPFFSLYNQSNQASNIAIKVLYDRFIIVLEYFLYNRVIKL